MSWQSIASPVRITRPMRLVSGFRGSETGNSCSGAGDSHRRSDTPARTSSASLMSYTSGDALVAAAFVRLAVLPLRVDNTRSGLPLRHGANAGYWSG